MVGLDPLGIAVVAPLEQQHQSYDDVFDRDHGQNRCLTEILILLEEG